MRSRSSSFLHRAGRPAIVRFQHRFLNRRGRFQRGYVKCIVSVGLSVALLATLTPSAPRALGHATTKHETSRSWFGNGWNAVFNWLAERSRPGSHAKVTSAPPASAYVSPLFFVGIPTGLNATATSNSSVSLSWSAPAGAVDHYQIERSAHVNGPFLLLGTSAGTTYTDSTVSANNAYLYRVRAIGSDGSFSSPSNMALGTAFSFEFSALQGQVVKAQHIYDLRTTINAVRAAANLAGASWTITNLSGALVQATVVQELRTKLDDALQALHIDNGPYTDPTLSTGSNGTLIKAIHLEQLQTRSTRGSSTSSGPLDSDSSTARLDPLNGTGGAGENPLSRNFNWNLPLLKLPGRADFDLSLTLSYNSLVWTKSGNSTISFDDDHGFPAAGFRLGFPTIQLPYFNSQTSTNAYLLIASDGSHIDLRQVSTNSVYYESADSHHLLLDTTLLTDQNDPRMVLRNTDGSQLTYKFKTVAYECTEVKDKNGNFITVNYNTSGPATGHIANVHDTLDRTITFNYDGTGLLTSISQQWKRQPPNQTQQITHTWASFAYTDLTLQTNFASGITVLGPANNSTKILTRVTLDDNSTTPANNSYFDFDYTPFGQVWKISNHAADTHLLNYRAYELPQSPIWTDPVVPQSDCPRFTKRHDWGQWANGDTDDTATPAEESVMTFSSLTAANWQMPDGMPHSGLMAQVTQPDGTFDKIYFADTVAGVAKPWLRGLQELVETYDVNGTVPQRQSFTSWEQDIETISYVLNPRVKETNISDSANNRKRTTITYQSFSPANGSAYKLPRDVFEWADSTNVLRSTRTDYVDGDTTINTPYLTHRILGLAKETTLYEGSVTSGGTLVSRVGFSYDETGSILGSDVPVQHDPTYGGSFVSGRGNVSTVKRYDVTNTGQPTTSTMKYNTAGAVVSTKDGLQHETKFDYTDSFSFGVTQTTFAYPTKVTDADGYYSMSQYNFDFGALTSIKTPPSNFTGDPNVQTQPAGPEQQLLYDDMGRLERSKNLVNNAYVRYEYPASKIRVDVFTTLIENSAEAHSFKIFDGFRRSIATASDHAATPGTLARFDGQRFEYDIMGRVIKTSNPAETSASVDNPSQWQLVEGDAGTSWVYTQQTYDWKGRPRVTTNPSMTSNPADTTTREISYTGCGCAGGEVATITDEGTLVNGTNKTRQQKTYSDVLGRKYKTEVWNFDGTGSGGNGRAIYSTTVTSYNARNQVTQVREYAGAEGSSNFQDTTMTYDGYGRLRNRHVPEQQVDINNSASTDHTTWDYNADDTIQKITDARGAISNFVYNGRQLVTQISYSLTAGVPTSGPSGVTSTGTTTFQYDAARNRKLMTDGFGSTTYGYDNLSRLTSEARTFTGLSGSYTLTYDYQPGGQLKSITDHTNGTINYSFDSSGRLSGVNGSGVLVGAVTAYASSFVYRAWGALKSVTDGSSHTTNVLYNNRMLPTHFDVSSSAASQDYDYYNDGRVSYSHNNIDNKWDRSFTFDHVGRLTVAASGGEARHDTTVVPMLETFDYNAFGHTTERFTETWLNDFFDSATYTNNRRNQWSYDADGRVSAIDERTYSYDAAGRNKSVAGQKTASDGTQIPTTTASEYDGDGQRVREIQTSNGTVTSTTYYLRSTILKGEIVEELNTSGQKQYGYVYTPSASAIARQVPTPDYITMKQLSPIGTSQYEFFKSNTTTGLDISFELDPLGAEIPRNSLHIGRGGHAGDMSGGTGSTDNRFGSIENPAAGCIGTLMLDGVPTPCDWVLRMGASGALQVQSGTTRQDIQMFGDSTIWVDAWEDYFTEGKGFVGIDENGNEQYDAGVTGTRNVGYFVNVEGAVPLGSLNPLPQSVSREQRLITETRNNVINLLNYKDKDGKNPCADFFGGAANAVAALNAIPFQPGAISDYKVGIEMSVPSGPVAAGTAYVTPGTATVNTNGGFYVTWHQDTSSSPVKTVGVPGFGTLGANNNQSRALQMLHELGHVIVTGLNANGTPIFKLALDGGNTKLSEQNTKAVEAACKDLIKSMIKN